mmetsp:Transcript_100508/g.260079  ORF Transcript_100508/g.260079 Transcript_100508/m.260079 type:complete len:211 (+) Transcript_100508:1732-2364(+)
MRPPRSQSLDARCRADRRLLPLGVTDVDPCREPGLEEHDAPADGPAGEVGSPSSAGTAVALLAEWRLADCAMAEGVEADLVPISSAASPPCSPGDNLLEEASSVSLPAVPNDARRPAARRLAEAPDRGGLAGGSTFHSSSVQVPQSISSGPQSKSLNSSRRASSWRILSFADFSSSANCLVFSGLDSNSRTLPFASAICALSKRTAAFRL